MIYWISGIIIFAVFCMGIRIVRPTHEALVETLGKYTYTAKSGFNWIIPIIQTTTYVNITERLVDIQEQTVITNDNLNCLIDGVVYFKVTDPFKAVYKADDFKKQIVSLARTTLRNIIGTMDFAQANSERSKINKQLEIELEKQTDAWGINIVRVELQEILPPKTVANAMNKIVEAEREKQASKDFAQAEVVKAEGEKRAAIERATGEKQSKILTAEGEAKSIKLVNEAANKYFTGNAVELEKLKTTQVSLSQNTKYVIDPNSNITNVIGDLSGTKILPTPKK